MSKKEKKMNNVVEPITLDIPEDEIWTYQIEGMAAPHINKPYKHAGIKKVIFALVIIVAVSLSMYFSLRTVTTDTFEYKQTESGYQFYKYTNPGSMKELTIDYVSDIVIEYPESEINQLTGEKGKAEITVTPDKTKPITSIREYALNCDGVVQVINIGADVLEIDGKSFYSCWALRKIEVDENNPNYCSVDGVLYNKDKTKVICVPCDHDTYLAEKYGYAVYAKIRDNSGKYIEDVDKLTRVEPTENGFEVAPGEVVPFADGQSLEDYETKVLTYVIPSSVTTVGELAFNYANMTTVYIPEGLKEIETLGFYEIPRLANVYSYKTDKEITDPAFTSQDDLGEVYLSLPEGLETIGSDAFTECMALTYMYIPKSVKTIGHHAFWATCFKEGNEIKGVNVMNVAADEETFDEVDCGDQWRPQYDYMLFNKSISINYSAERQTID